MRFSTWRTPRYIFCGELSSNRLFLPRGTLADCLELAKVAGARVNLIDKRVGLKKIKMRFRGELSREQKKAVTQLAKFEDGVLVAPPGMGKTVIACALIGKRKVRTLILVHRKQLLEQWERQLSRFLTVKPKRIGVKNFGLSERWGKERGKKLWTGKSDALIYDYLDSSSGLTISMFKKRVAAYKKMGYRIESPGGGKADRELGQKELF